MYVDQHNMLNYNDNNFVIPSYFASWVSGFIEAEGHFRTYFDKRRNMQVHNRFNIGQNFFNILSLKPSEIILGGLIKFKLLSLKKTSQGDGNS